MIHKSENPTQKAHMIRPNSSVSSEAGMNSLLPQLSHRTHRLKGAVHVAGPVGADRQQHQCEAAAQPQYGSHNVQKFYQRIPVHDFPSIA